MFEVLHKEILPTELLSFTRFAPKLNCSACNYNRDYNPQLKCCTFQPLIMNFLLGGFLNKNGTHADVLNNSQVICTPLALVPSSEYKEKFLKNKFAQNPDLLCVFYHNSQCLNYLFRGSTCRTFFCTSDKNIKTFWEECDSYIYAVELGIAQLLLLDLGFTFNELQKELRFVNGEIEDKPTIVDKEFYLECFNLFQAKKHMYAHEAQESLKYRLQSLLDLISQTFQYTSRQL